MKKSLAIVFFGVVFCLLFGLNLAWAKAFRQALPGYRYAFPADHASHPAFKTEWWYYTGHLQAKNGRRFGYQLTFFRFGLDLQDPPLKSHWGMQDVHMAHFAVSDVSNRRFSCHQFLNRPSLGIAGASTKGYRVWNQDWFASLDAQGRHVLQAKAGDVALQLNLSSAKPPVIHGQDGVSQKASCKGCASHYYSLARMPTVGRMTLNGESLAVKGSSWMDHEFGSNQLTSRQVGWDWFSLQLDDGSEVMLYALRNRDGSLDPNSSGTWVDAQGVGHPLALRDFTITPLGQWRSPTSQATYPSGWRLAIPRFGFVGTVTPAFPNQELDFRNVSRLLYWEGTSTVSATRYGKPLQGQAYVELTGYGQPFRTQI